MALSSSQKLLLQPYPREGQLLLSANFLYRKKTPPITVKELEVVIDSAFQRCLKNKKGDIKIYNETPQSLVVSTIKHLKERSDPILSPYFLGLLKPEEIFELDAVSYEMQRHRMSIGVFYQYLILELMRKSWHVFDGSREGDVIADIDTPKFEKGMRLYMSIKKSKDTVGGQDISGVIRRLESEAKSEKNLSRPYLCVIGIATPSKGKLKGYDDRTTKADKSGKPYSLNCEFWGPGFIFPYISGLEAIEIYTIAIKHVSNYLPFMTLKFKAECSILLKKELEKLDLLNSENRIDRNKYLKFIIG
ncbi:MAG: hypothetical protein K8R86_03185 [Bacteroidales bacterium]|nr:hypothetical protein [Bacteroidales bacterium]